jgi:hypothetical protein
MTLTPEQIIISRNRLIFEGFTPASPAVRVHDQLLALMTAHEVNTNGAVESIEDLKTECERLRASLSRMCEVYGDIAFSVGMGRLQSREQWESADEVLSEARAILAAESEVK